MNTISRARQRANRQHNRYKRRGTAKNLIEQFNPFDLKKIMLIFQSLHIRPNPLLHLCCFHPHLAAFGSLLPQRTISGRQRRRWPRAFLPRKPLSTTHRRQTKHRHTRPHERRARFPFRHRVPSWRATSLYMVPPVRVSFYRFINLMTRQKWCSLHDDNDDDGCDAWALRNLCKYISDTMYT